MVNVLLTSLTTVTTFDVANLKSAYTHKDGGCPNHDLRIVIDVNVADPQNANNHKDGASPAPPAPPAPQGGGERSE